MSQDIFPVSISNLEDLEELYQAIDFFRKHEYHLPSITQSNDGLRFATKYWLNPRVKSDKYIFSIQNEVDSVINNLLEPGSNDDTPQDSISEPDEIKWEQFDPTPYIGCDVPPTEPPAAIPAPDESEWKQFDPTPYIGCDVPETEPPAAIPAPDESEAREDEGIVRYDDKNARQRREIEQRQASRPTLKRSRRSLFESYESQEFKSMIRKGLERLLKDK